MTPNRVGSEPEVFFSCRRCGYLARQTDHQYRCLAACDREGNPRIIGYEARTPDWCPVNEDNRIKAGAER